MLLELALLNKLYKSKEFTLIKPRVTEFDLVVYVTTGATKNVKSTKKGSCFNESDLSKL